MNIKFKVNDEVVEVEIEPRVSLADCLRDSLQLTGTHLGCEHGVCGACTVIVNGEAVRACLMLAVQVDGDSVVTVEGLSNEDALTPLQAASAGGSSLSSAGGVVVMPGVPPPQ